MDPNAGRTWRKEKDPGTVTQIKSEQPSLLRDQADTEDELTLWDCG